MTIKKIAKLVGSLILFVVASSLLFFGFLYFKYNEDFPTGIEGAQADALANKMLEALNHKAYESTNYLEWTFKGIHHYKWQKNDNTCEVSWDNYTVNLVLNNASDSKVFINVEEISGQQKEELIQTATNYFNNDSFWLVAPYKVFDDGVKRSLVTHDNKDALLVSYTRGGSTPGDSYLWILDDTGKPTSYKMWTSILPIQGLPASWDEWTITESGAVLPTNHKLLFLDLTMGAVKGTH